MSPNRAEVLGQPIGLADLVEGAQMELPPSVRNA